MTPTNTTRSFKFSMSTKQTPNEVVFQELYRNFKSDVLMCEKIDMPMRDGMQIPVVMVYDKRFYSDESPWVLFTRGVDSSKEDLAF